MHQRTRSHHGRSSALGFGNMNGEPSAISARAAMMAPCSPSHSRPVDPTVHFLRSALFQEMIQKFILVFSLPTL